MKKGVLMVLLAGFLLLVALYVYHANSLEEGLSWAAKLKKKKGMNKFKKKSVKKSQRKKNSWKRAARRERSSLTNKQAAAGGYKGERKYKVSLAKGPSPSQGGYLSSPFMGDASKIKGKPTMAATKVWAAESRKNFNPQWQGRRSSAHNKRAAMGVLQHGGGRFSRNKRMASVKSQPTAYVNRVSSGFSSPALLKAIEKENARLKEERALSQRKVKQMEVGNYQNRANPKEEVETLLYPFKKGYKMYLQGL